MSFSDFDLHPALQRAIADQGFTQPPPIQEKALPPGLAGRDVLACAMTGSGKTAAFVLPLLQRLGASPNRGATRALILTPTRELAAQVEEHLRALGRHTRVRSATVIGGVSHAPQERALRSGVDVVVATRAGAAAGGARPRAARSLPRRAPAGSGGSGTSPCR